MPDVIDRARELQDVAREAMKSAVNASGGASSCLGRATLNQIGFLYTDTNLTDAAMPPQSFHGLNEEEFWAEYNWDQIFESQGAGE